MKLTIGDFTRSSLQAPGIKVDTSGVNLLNSVNRTLTKVADDSFKEWSSQKIDKASQAGQIAGAQNAPMYQEGNTLTAQAYNQSAKKSQLARMTIDNNAAMTSFANDFKDDPTGYLEASNKYINEVTETLGENEQTRDLKEIMGQQLKLTQQFGGYEVSKNYNIKQTQQMKADNEALYQTVKTNTFMHAGGIFSKDAAQQNLTLSNFSMNKKMLSASLHAVTPDGQPIFTAQQIQAREQQFHTQFYAKATEQWIAATDLDAKDIQRLKTGGIEFNVPGTDGMINIYQEIGPEAYEQLKANAFRKMKDQDAAERQKISVEKEASDHAREVNDVKLIDDIYSGAMASTESVHTMLKDGSISKSAAKNAIKMLRSGESRKDDVGFAVDVELRQATGEDVSDELNLNAHRLSPTTYKRLMKNQITKDSSLEDKINSQNRKWISNEMSQRDQFGMVDPKAQRLLSDTIVRYNQSITDGNSPDVAMEEARDVMDVLRSRENRKMFEAVPRYAVIQGNTLNYIGTLDATIKAFDEGKITFEQLTIESDRIAEAESKGK